MPQKRMECFRLLFNHLAWIKHQPLSGIRDSRKARSLWEIVGGVRKSIHQSGLGLGLLYWGFKGVQEKIPMEEASTLEIGSVAFPPGQCTSPQVHPCHRLFDQAQRLSLWDNWGDERGCDKSPWYAHTRGLPWGLPEVVGTVQVYCSRRRLLRRGLKFHVCTINKNAHTKKSGNSFDDPRIFIFYRYYAWNIQKGGLIEFNSVSTHLGLFYP